MQSLHKLKYQPSQDRLIAPSEAGRFGRLGNLNPASLLLATTLKLFKSPQAS
jgi:hypothetical protein